MFLRHPARPFVVVSILVTLVAGGVFAVVVTAGGRSSQGPAATAGAQDRESSELGVDADAGEEADEVETVATERAHDALRGGHTQLTQVVTAAAPGWAGQTIVGGGDDDWEPAIAADRSSPYVYVMYNRFGGATACQQCPSPAMLVQVSSDGGATFGPQNFLCTCKGVQSQYDPVLTVTSTGSVYATWMNTNKIMFSRSTNHAATWSTPIQVSGKQWADKPWMGISSNGADVYIAYESRSQLQIASSHNGGTSFSAPITVNSGNGNYRYPNGFVVLPSGTAILAASSYPNGGGKTSGNVDIETWRSTNGGTSWTRQAVDLVTTGVDFDTSSTTTITADPSGALVLEYSGATAVGSPGHIYVRRSTDQGLTWSARTELTRGTGNASFPAAASPSNGTFHAMWQESRGGVWNTYVRTSTDGGATWGAEVDISDATSGAPYVSPAGYAAPYGDYGMMAITSAGKAIAAWGEGASFALGPGGIWINRQT
jgi:BNR repeat-like domain